MPRHPFTAYQLFRTKQENIEPQIIDYYRESHDGETVIKLVRLLQIRDVLGTETLDRPCLSLVRSLYIHPVSESMRRYFFYFHAYFSEKEWACLLLPLFQVMPQFQEIRAIYDRSVLLMRVSDQFTVP